jgi:hypothetical protein
MTPAEHDQRPETLRWIAAEILERASLVFERNNAADLTAAADELDLLRTEVERLRAENAILRRIPDKVASDERERCASLCERLPYGSGLAGRTYAEAIRGVGLGARLAKGGTP